MARDLDAVPRAFSINPSPSFLSRRSLHVTRPAKPRGGRRTHSGSCCADDDDNSGGQSDGDQRWFSCSFVNELDKWTGAVSIQTSTRRGRLRRNTPRAPDTMIDQVSFSFAFFWCRYSLAVPLLHCFLLFTPSHHLAEISYFIPEYSTYPTFGLLFLNPELSLNVYIYISPAPLSIPPTLYRRLRRALCALVPFSLMRFFYACLPVCFRAFVCPKSIVRDGTSRPGL